MKNPLEILKSLFAGGRVVDRRKELGSRGESLAAKLYKNQGFIILDKNFRCPIGELDLVARKGDLLVFCEVKTRRSVKFGPPEMAVNASKRRRIIKLADFYIKRRNLGSLQVRFDVVSVYWEEGGRPEVRHIPSAFTA